MRNPLSTRIPTVHFAKCLDVSVENPQGAIGAMDFLAFEKGNYNWRCMYRFSKPANGMMQVLKGGNHSEGLKLNWTP